MLPAGERKVDQAAAGVVDAGVRVVAHPRCVAAEFQRRLCPGVLRRACISPERWPGGCRWARCSPRTLLLNVFYYHEPVFSGYMLVKTLSFAALVGLGRLFSPRTNFLKLLGGGLFGAILFYFITNTASWLQNPEYAKTLAGWIQALTTGIAQLSVHLGIFPQHTPERRPLHRPVRRRDETHRPRRIARRKRSRRARPRTRNRRNAGGGEGVNLKCVSSEGRVTRVPDYPGIWDSCNSPLR